MENVRYRDISDIRTKELELAKGDCFEYADKNFNIFSDDRFNFPLRYCRNIRCNR